MLPMMSPDFVDVADVDGNDVDDRHVTSEDSISDNEASCQQVAKEQRKDETLKGCFRLAKSGNGGVLLLDSLLYHKKTVIIIFVY